MIYKEDSAFLDWIANRIIYRVGDSEKDWHILYMRDLSSRIKNPTISIEDKKLDNIISKYYVDFFLDKSDTMGFHEQERTQLRSTIRSILEDIISQKNIQPKIGP